jgi:hypothetical protein
MYRILRRKHAKTEFGTVNIHLCTEPSYPAAAVVGSANVVMANGCTNGSVEQS